MISLVLLLLLLLAIAAGAGTLGATLGLGGGLIIVPALVLLFGVDLDVAIACSLLSVIATSAGSASRYARQGMLHLRLGFFLETATVVGGLFGAVLTTLVLSGTLGREILFGAFALIALSAAGLVARDLSRGHVIASAPDPVADRWQLHGNVPAHDGVPARPFRVGKVREGLALSFVAGLASGLLGVGGGIYKVPAMTGLMGVPMKMASATSSMMIGVTAAGGAVVYLLQGDVAPLIVAPVAIGTLLGSYAGSRLQALASSQLLRGMFIVVLLVAAVLMVAKALGVPWA